MNELFFVVHVQVMKDGAHASVMTEYTDLASAKSAFYSALASDSISTTLASYSCTILNYHGGVEKNEYFDYVINTESED